MNEPLVSKYPSESFTVAFPSRFQPISCRSKDQALSGWEAWSSSNHCWSAAAALELHPLGRLTVPTRVLHLIKNEKFSDKICMFASLIYFGSDEKVRYLVIG